MRAIEHTITEDKYEDLLNEVFEHCVIGHIEFDAGRVLRELDPIAFRCGMADEPSEWECDECGEIYESEEEAEECCQEYEEEE